MKRLFKILIALLALNLVFISGCKDDDPDTRPDNEAFELLSEYMLQNNMDLDDMLINWIVDPPALDDLDNFLSSYYILDIRGSAYYNNGHIEGAITSSLADCVIDAANADKPILLVSQTGQTSGQALVALRLMGYPECTVLRWGMAGWNNQFAASWLNNVGDKIEEFPNWEAAPRNLSTPETHIEPFISTLKTTATEILLERVLGDDGRIGGFRDITAETVIKSPTGYFTNAYLDVSGVEEYGHVKGAYSIKPLSIAGGEIFNLSPDKNIAIYSWTGHISSVVTFWLAVLGYDSESLLFGANSMIYSDLESHKYLAPTTDLPVIIE